MVNARRPGGTRSSWATAVVNQRPPVVVSANSCRVLSSPFSLAIMMAEYEQALAAQRLPVTRAYASK